MPPATLTVALPVIAPKHPTFVCALMELESPVAGCVMVTVLVVEHPLASVIVQVQVPTVRLFAVANVCTGAVFQLNA